MAGSLKNNIFTVGSIHLANPESSLATLLMNSRAVSIGMPIFAGSIGPFTRSLEPSLAFRWTAER